jgi:hypothetical protein
MQAGANVQRNDRLLWGGKGKEHVAANEDVPARTHRGEKRRGLARVHDLLAEMENPLRSIHKYFLKKPYPFLTGGLGQELESPFQDLRKVFSGIAVMEHQVFEFSLFGGR